MNQQSEHFKLFAECIPVKGAARSVIYDLPRNSYTLIPNALYDILTQQEGATLSQLKSDYDAEDQQTIDEYFQMLQDNEYIFFCDKDELALFPKLPEEWDYAGDISNAIVELPMERQLLSKAIRELEQLGCRHIQFRSLQTLDADILSFVLNEVSTRDIDTIEVISKTDHTMDTESFKRIFAANPRLRTWILYGAESTAATNIDDMGRQNLIFSAESKTAHRDFERNGPHYFNVNIELFFESKKHHAYYNRKVCITSEGDIKNCLSLPAIFGNLASTPLKSIIDLADFKKLWYISNDHIETCKHCEFRYMCVDNSPLHVNGDTVRRENTCFYDPFTATFTHGKQLV